jgi:hypothetical protein
MKVPADTWSLEMARNVAPPESAVLRQCLQALRLLKVPHVRVNGGAVTFESGGRRRYVRFTSTPGTSDIIGVLPGAGPGPWPDTRGTFLAVETKGEGGRLTAEQRAFLNAVRAAGGVAACVSSVGELVALLAELGYGSLRA